MAIATATKPVPTQPAKPVATQAPIPPKGADQRPTLTVVKEPKFLRYPVEELRASIERRQKRRELLVEQLKKLDAAIAAREARLKELQRK